MLLLAIAVPGCKKKEPPPPPAKATPLPKKPEQATAPAAPVLPVKPVQAALSTSKKLPVKNIVQAQLTTSKRIVAPAGVSLDFTNKRDPFKPYAQMPLPQQSSANKSSKGRVRDPLPIQTFDTEKLKVSGIVTGLKENTALIIDPNNKGYVVRQGMLIGNNDGVVKKITSNAVEVEESSRDDNGRIRKRVVKLTLLRKK
ncbi:MAG: pilus assembly protein PilP [Geobacteraceae bacterium]|nr:pilus assembly protein PilP [Geobacteraceae bacterium]